MSAEPNPSGTLVILLALDFQFMTVFTLILLQSNMCLSIFHKTHTKYFLHVLAADWHFIISNKW